MSEWITDRLPTEEDADCFGQVWASKGERTLLTTWSYVKEGIAWMPTNRPEPYVEPKIQRYIIAALSNRDDRWFTLEKCGNEIPSAICISDDVKHLEAINAELLALLKDFLPWAEAASESLGRFCSDEGWDQEDMDRTEEFDARLSLLHAAIAKAEGGSDEDQ